MYYSLEDWIYILSKYNVIERLNDKELIKSIVIDLNKSGYECNEDSLRKALKRLGYKKSQTQGLYYLETQQESIRLMDSIDIEETIEEISHKRYYDCFKEGYFDREERETVSIEIDKQIYEEFTELSEINGCDLEDEYLVMVLLDHLQEVRAKDKTREFALSSMIENEDYSKEEIKFMLDKEKEGYSLEGLMYLAEDYNLIELSDEEFKEVAGVI